MFPGRAGIPTRDGDGRALLTVELEKGDGERLVGDPTGS
jgi:hypothetical protein